MNETKEQRHVRHTHAEEVAHLKRGIRQLSALMDQATADKTDELSEIIAGQFKAKVVELLK